MFRDGAKSQFLSVSLQVPNTHWWKSRSEAETGPTLRRSNGRLTERERERERETMIPRPRAHTRPQASTQAFMCMCLNNSSHAAGGGGREGARGEGR